MTISTQKTELEIPNTCPKCGGRINEITPHEHNCLSCGKYIDWDEKWVSTIVTPTAKYSFFVSDMVRTSEGERNRKGEQADFENFVKLNPGITRRKAQLALGLRYKRILEIEKISGLTLADDSLTEEEKENDPIGLRAIKAKRRQIRLSEILDDDPTATVSQISKITGWTQSGVIFTARCIGHKFQNSRNAKLKFHALQSEKNLQLIKKVVKADPEISPMEIAESYDINVWQVRKLATELGIKFPSRQGSPNVNKIRQHLMDNPQIKMRELAGLVNANPHTVAYYCEVYSESEGGLFDVIDRDNYQLRTKQQRQRGIADQNSKRKMLNGNLNPRLAHAISWKKNAPTAQ